MTPQRIATVFTIVLDALHWWPFFECLSHVSCTWCDVIKWRIEWSLPGVHRILCEKVINNFLKVCNNLASYYVSVFMVSNPRYWFKLAIALTVLKLQHFSQGFKLPEMSAYDIFQCNRYVWIWSHTTRYPRLLLPSRIYSWRPETNKQAVYTRLSV